MVVRYLGRGGLGLLVAVAAAVFLAPAAAHAAGPTVLYRIEQRTGDVPDGGTDSTVSVQLCGTAGCTPVRELDDPDRDDRERGNTDVYTREWENVGNLRTLRILQKSDGSGWYLDTVRIKYGSRVASFPYDGWMVKDRWVDIAAG